MGLRYSVFRLMYVVKCKLGISKNKFPENPLFKEFIKLEQWRQYTPLFFFKDRGDLELPKKKNDTLKETFSQIMAGNFTFFHKIQFDLGKKMDWMANPESRFVYDKTQHFSKVKDLSKESGDIKYVWEMARFSSLYDIIRYDFHFEQDNSAYVFEQIEDFIHGNPMNMGPNYKCSQEISLRILNWTFALYFYKNSINLTEQRFKLIMNAIYWQLDHVITISIFPG